MSSPTVFTGSRTKFISSKGALLKDGSVIDNDGVPNFIKNGHAEIDTTGWATYADAAQSTPVDGTGGTANVTWARTTTTPLAGAGSFTFTKDTANRQGQGVSYTFNVDPSYRARVCNIQFDYIFTNINGSFDTSNPNLTVYIYDVTNATVIQPSSFGLLSNSQTIADTFQSSFQTSATGSQYRLIFHVATVSTSGYTIKFDNIQVTPTQYAFGTPVTDWVSYTPTLKGTVSDPNIGSTGTIWGRWRRVGDSAEIQVGLSAAGTGVSTGSGSYYFTYPSGISLDTTRYNGSIFYPSGVAAYYNQGVASSNALSYLTTQGIFMTANGGSDAIGQNIPSSNWFTAGDVLGAKITVPVTGWSSSVQMSDQTSTRVIAARAYRNAAQTVTTTAAKISFDVVNFDDVGGWSGGTYTVKVPGKYRIKLITCVDGVSTDIFHQSYIYIDGAAQSNMFNCYGAGNSYSSAVNELLWVCNAGTTIEGWIRNNLNSRSLVTGTGVTYMEIERISGPNQIAASETVALSAYRSAGNYTVTAGNTQTLIPNVKIVDTHGILNTSTGVVTIPVSGIYEITYKQAFSSTAAGTVGYTRIVVGAINVSSSWVVTDSANSNYRTIVNTHLTYLTSGQTLTQELCTTRLMANKSTLQVWIFLTN